MNVILGWFQAVDRKHWIFFSHTRIQTWADSLVYLQHFALQNQLSSFSIKFLFVLFALPPLHRWLISISMLLWERPQLLYLLVAPLAELFTFLQYFIQVELADDVLLQKRRVRVSVRNGVWVWIWLVDDMSTISSDFSSLLPFFTPYQFVLNTWAKDGRKGKLDKRKSVAWNITLMGVLHGDESQ